MKTPEFYRKRLWDNPTTQASLVRELIEDYEKAIDKAAKALSAYQELRSRQSPRDEWDRIPGNDQRFS